MADPTSLTAQPGSKSTGRDAEPIVAMSNPTDAEDNEPPVWLQRLVRVILLGVAFPTLMTAFGCWLGWVLRRDPLWHRLSHPPHLVSLLAAIPLTLVSLAIVITLLCIPTIRKALERDKTVEEQDPVQIFGRPSLVFVGATSGVWEEVLFRGALQPTLTLPLTALLFAFLHGGWRKRRRPVVLVAILGGCLLGTIYNRTGNLWLCILVHILHNSSVTLLAGKKITIPFGKWLTKLRENRKPVRTSSGRYYDIPGVDFRREE